MTNVADPALLAALMLLAGIVGGYAGALLRVPRVVGYLMAGVGLRYLLAAVQDYWVDNPPEHALSTAVHSLHGVRTVALGLIMFSIGNVFEARHFHTIAHNVLRLSLVKIGATLVLVPVGCTIVALGLTSFTPTVSVALGVLLGVVAVATAPAATLLVLREYEAKGTNADAILTMTAVNNIVCIVLFHAVFIGLSGTGLIESSYSTGRWLWLDLLLISVGSIGLGVVIGFIFSVLYIKITIADFMLVFLGVLVVLGIFHGVLSERLHLSYSFLLVALFIGATFANITPDQEPFHNALRVFSGPIFALFFVLAGFELHVGDLAHLGWLGAAYVVFRVLGKGLGGWLGVCWVQSNEYVPNIGLGMLCQAGVAIGLAAFVASTWGTVTDGVFRAHPAAEAFETIVLGSVVLFELFGPIALKRVAVYSGEVKAVTLLRRRRTPGHESESIWQQAFEALARTIRPGARRPPPATRAIEVRDIMRSNVKVLYAAARFDDVLHFAENSRLNHFPVVEQDGEFVGMIHYADLRHIIYDPAVRNLVTATDLARGDSPTVTRDTPLSELFRRFHDTNLDSIAVVETGPARRVVGVVEQSDLLLAVRAEEERPGGNNA